MDEIISVASPRRNAGDEFSENKSANAKIGSRMACRQAWLYGNMDKGFIKWRAFQTINIHNKEKPLS
jgi:hypothetical protein